MSIQEQAPRLKEPASFQSLIHDVPEAISFAKIEAESAGMAKTPEGQYVLTYLFSARNLLRPVLTQAHIHRDLMQQTGGYDYNPTRNIDDIGTAIVLTLAKDSPDLTNTWIHTEESGNWIPGRTDNGFWEDADRFAVVDSLDMTSSIALGDRVQTTGMAIYTKNGDLLSAGIISLVDDQYIFVEKSNGGYAVHSTAQTDTDKTDADFHALRYAAKTRRMYTLNTTPLVQNGHTRVLDCDSGYAVLQLHKGTVDTVIDHVKGNPWYEIVIWIRTAQALGYPVTDMHGNSVDIAAVVRRAISHNESDTYRIPFVVSRTPEIHERVLKLLNTEK